MILTGWDLKSLYAPDVAPEWTILTATEMETKLPLAHKLFTDTVNGVLVNPTQAYLDGLTFSSLPTASAAPPTPNSSAVTIAVSVAANNAGSGNVYVIEGTQKKSLTLEVGKTYTFTHPTGHPLRFSKTSDGTHSTSSGYPSPELREYTTGVTTTGTAGSSGASVELVVSASTPTKLYYQCGAHALMGTYFFVESAIDNVTLTELSYLDGVTSSVQTQISEKFALDASNNIDLSSYTYGYIKQF